MGLSGSRHDSPVLPGVAPALILWPGYSALAPVGPGHPFPSCLDNLQAQEDAGDHPDEAAFRADLPCAFTSTT